MVSSVVEQQLMLFDGQRVVAVQIGAQPPVGIEVIDLGAATRPSGH
jgi:hypothetical protein